MDFKTLNEYVPYHLVGKEKSIRYTPYPNIVLAMPGRHALDTSPPGGDFVVMVTDPVFPRAEHQFTHTDIFKVVEHKRNIQANPAQFLMKDYLAIVQGGDVPAMPTNYTVSLLGEYFNETMNEVTFLQAVQCLAVAEHRRYRQFENKFGGRYLPFRFATGIAEGLWDAADAASMQKKGRPGVEILEKMNGVPRLTQELMK